VANRKTDPFATELPELVDRKLLQDRGLWKEKKLCVNKEIMQHDDY
jgi:hypothetical protein